MLVLSRKKGEAIMIGDQIEIVVLSSEGDTVKIGINAPKQVEVYRKELFLSIQESNAEASKSHIEMDALSKLFRKTE